MPEPAVGPVMVTFKPLLSSPLVIACPLYVLSPLPVKVAVATAPQVILIVVSCVASVTVSAGTWPLTN